jgi:hypothetical protein
VRRGRRSPCLHQTQLPVEEALRCLLEVFCLGRSKLVQDFRCKPFRNQEVAFVKYKIMNILGQYWQGNLDGSSRRAPSTIRVVRRTTLVWFRR